MGRKKRYCKAEKKDKWRETDRKRTREQDGTKIDLSEQESEKKDLVNERRATENEMQREEEIGLSYCKQKDLD